jgi:hypothetical protein
VRDEATPVDSNSLKRGYELDWIKPRPILRWTALVLAVMGVAVLSLRLTYHRSAHVGVSDPQRSEAHPPNPFATDHGQPVLQESPAREMAEFLAKENVILKSYEWVDRPAGRVRVPIDRAKVLLLQKGLPTRRTQP